MLTLDTVDPQAAADVRTFAADVSAGCAALISLSLEVDAESVKVICLYRDSDVTKLDLLTLAGSCASSRRLKEVSATQDRRLQVVGFVVEVHVVGADVQAMTQADPDNTGHSVAEILASKIASTEILIESMLLPEGLTISAALRETRVVVATEAPAPAPTAVPSPLSVLPGVEDAHQPHNVVEETRPPADEPLVATLTTVVLALLVVVIFLLLVIIFGFGVLLWVRGKMNRPRVETFHVFED
jgi:hypothetical protein